MATDAETKVLQLKTTKQFFDKTIAALTEAEAGFAPKPEMFTAAQQIAHTAQVVDWFIDGAFIKNKFRMDFEAMNAEIKKIKTLKEARAWLDSSFAKAVEVIGSKTDAQLSELYVDQSVLGAQPKGAAVSGIIDHTAHHRGALSVYERMLGKTPPSRTVEVEGRHPARHDGKRI